MCHEDFSQKLTSMCSQNDSSTIALQESGWTEDPSKDSLLSHLVQTTEDIVENSDLLP